MIAFVSVLLRTKIATILMALAVGTTVQCAGSIPQIFFNFFTPSNKNLTNCFLYYKLHPSIFMPYFGSEFFILYIKNAE